MNWPTAKLNDVAPAKSLKPEGVKGDADVWQITLDHIESHTGQILERNIRPISEAGTSTHWFDENYVLYSKLRPYLNKVLLPDRIGLGTTELVPMLPNKELLDRRYLAHYLRSPRFVGWVSSQTAGAKMPRVSMKVFWEHEIPLPPLKEQERIAAILDKADNLRRKRQQAIQLADEFLRAVFLDMFGDPVANPKKWDVRLLKDLASKIGSGATPRGGKEAYQEEGISLIRSLNIHDNSFLYKDLAHINEDQADRLSNVVVESGDVLLNITGASVCRCAIVDDESLPARVNQHVCIIRPESLSSNFLLHLLISGPYKRHLLNMAGAGGATREALTKQQVESLRIPVPPAEMLKKFDAICSRLENLGARTTRFLEEPIFESLSQNAFSGEL